MTLTDFLLARITEDEAVARQPDIAAVAAYNRIAALREDLGDWTTLAIDPGRWLEECEAKRRIVGWAGGGDPSDSDERWVLGNLALPYADHPDYREEWRP